MVKPLTAAVTSKSSGVRLLKLALTSMTRSTRRPFLTDFVSPPPRLSKGKEKAVEPLSVDCNHCRLPSWDPTSNTSCASRHSPWCPCTPFASYHPVSRLTLYFQSEIDCSCWMKPFPVDHNPCSTLPTDAHDATLRLQHVRSPLRRAYSIGREPSDPRTNPKILLTSSVPF